MQEAKYCDDIIPKIKASLEALGFTNEHDRLGHFESAVPADTFFGLASQHQNVRLFGLQFKAPNKHLEWDLTHTRDQFDKIRLFWSDVIYYALPWYTDLQDSDIGLDLCAFLNPRHIPEEPSRIVRSESPIPDEYIARLLCSYCDDFISNRIFNRDNVVGHKKDLSEIYSVILSHGPDEIIRLCIEAFNEDNYEIVKSIGFRPEYARIIAVHFRESARGYIRDWNGNGVKCDNGRHFADKMIARVLLKVAFKGKNKPLKFNGKVHVEDLRMVYGGPYLNWDGFPGMIPLSNMCEFRGTTDYLTWEKVVSKIKEGEFGVEIGDLDLVRFKDQFGDRFSGEESAIVVWYSHVERIFYALETKRIVKNVHENALGFMRDPLIAGLTPEMRTKLAKAASKRGITPSTLLNRIINDFLSELEDT
jgi:hypothetical protein